MVLQTALKGLTSKFVQATQSQRATVVLKHVREAADSACRKIVMMRSFEKAGIVPFNPKIVYDSPVCPKMSAEDAATGAAVIDIAQAPVEASNPVQKKRKRSMVNIDNRLLTGEEAIQEIREFEPKKMEKRQPKKRRSKNNTSEKSSEAIDHIGTSTDANQ